MSIDLSALPIAELNRLAKQVKKEIRAKQGQQRKAAAKERAEKKRAALKQIKELAASHGLSIEEVLAAKPGRRSRGKEGVEKARTSKSPPKYRNPDNPDQTWTGKGRKPGWLLEALSQGKSLEDLAA